MAIDRKLRFATRAELAAHVGDLLLQLNSAALGALDLGDEVAWRKLTSGLTDAYDAKQALLDNREGA